MLVELHNTGDATVRTEVQAVVEHVLSGRPGEWRVSIVGSRAKEDWEMKGNVRQLSNPVSRHSTIPPAGVCFIPHNLH